MLLTYLYQFIHLWQEYMSWSQMLGFKIGDPSGMAFKLLGQTVGLIRSQYYITTVIPRRRAEMRREALRRIHRQCPDLRLNTDGGFRLNESVYI